MKFVRSFFNVGYAIVFFNAIVVLLIYFCLDSIYLSVDDSKINLIYAGVSNDNGSAFILYQNIILGLIVKYLYVLDHNINWYPYILLTFFTISSSLLLYYFYKNFSHLKFLLFYVSVFYIFLLEYLLRINFTYSGYLLAGSSIFAFVYTLNKAKRAFSINFIIPYGLLFLSSLPRPMASLSAVCIVATSIFFISKARIRFRLFHSILSVVFIFTLYFIHTFSFQINEQRKEMWKVTKYFDHIVNFPVAGNSKDYNTFGNYTNDKESFETLKTPSYNFSHAELSLIAKRFYNIDFYTTDKFKEIFETIMDRFSLSTAITRLVKSLMFKSNCLFFVIAIIIFLPLILCNKASIIFVSYLKMLPLIIMVFAQLFYISIFKHIQIYVMDGMLFCLVTSILSIFINFNHELVKLNSIKKVFCLIFVVLCSLLIYRKSYALKEIVKDNKLLITYTKNVVTKLNSEKYNEKIKIAPSWHMFYNSFNRLSANDIRSLAIIPSGWFTSTIYYKDLVEKHDITDELEFRKDSDKVIYLSPPIKELTEFFKERNKNISFKKIEQVGEHIDVVNNDISVYKVKVSRN